MINQLHTHQVRSECPGFGAAFPPDKARDASPATSTANPPRPRPALPGPPPFTTPHAPSRPASGLLPPRSTLQPDWPARPCVVYSAYRPALGPIEGRDDCPGSTQRRHKIMVRCPRSFERAADSAERTRTRTPAVPTPRPGPHATEAARHPQPPPAPQAAPTPAPHLPRDLRAGDPGGAHTYSHKDLLALVANIAAKHIRRSVKQLIHDVG